jgi:LuxR family transcriptional regulator, maltose regulon positive regulatory protein
MAKPPARTPLEPAPLERDALLATKLHIPRPRPGLLPRPHLLQQLGKGTASALTLVCAPAGFGKTSLLAEWARGRPEPVAWLSLDAGDSDPARFWRYVAAALDGLRAGLAGQVAALLRGPQQPPLEAVLTVVVNELADAGEEVVLVLDDYHLIDTPAVHASLTMLLERLPPQLRLIMASRSDPPLPLARLRARGQLAELREADLRFTAEETAALLREATGLELPAAPVTVLAERTEGWVAGLQLAVLSLAGRTDPASFVHTFTGSHRYVLDYLTEEVLARQPDHLVRFLLETSMLERLSGPLCQAVTGRADSQALLEQVERANLFLVPLDEVRGWWRYHQLFADLLRARLQQQHSDRVPALHRAAAGWSEEHGLVDEAVRHTLAAGEAVWAARLVEQHFDDMLRRCEDATLRRWLEALPAEVVRSRPRLCLAQAFAAVTAVRLEAAASLLDDAERALADRGDKPEEPFEPSVGRAASVLANVPAGIALARAVLARMHGDAEQTTEFSRQALAQLGEGERMLRSQAEWYLAVADWLCGRLPEAEQALAGLATEQLAAGAGYVAPNYHDLGLVQRARGRLEAALGTYRQLLEVAAAPGQPVLPAAGVAHVGMAEVLYERGQLDAALDHATQGVALARQVGWTRSLVAGLAILAWIRHAQGDRAGALAAIAEAERVQLSRAVVGPFNPLPALRARLALAQGEVSEAARWVQQHGLTPDDQPSYPREGEYLVLARVLLARQAPERALGLLERLHALAAAQARVGSVIEVLALQALALAAAGDHERALAALAEALTLAAPEDYLRVFLDEGAPMASLLGKLATSPAKVRAVTTTPLARAHLDRLIHAFNRQGLPILGRPRPGGAVAPGLVEPLSPRELEVLELLADGRSNQAVAEELVISLDTVKRHVSHVLDKLGAANRTQAVTRARDLGLLG